MPILDNSQLNVLYLGKADFLEVTHKLQKEIAEKRKRGEISDTLILFEPNNPTYALGLLTRNQPDNLIFKKQRGEISKLASITEVDRGGHVTFHGPGQIIGYLIASLPASRKEDFIARIEVALQQTARSFNVETYIKTERELDPRASEKLLKRQYGVWCKEDGIECKLAALGLKFDGVSSADKLVSISRHGFLFNVSTDLEYFNLIYPCGFRDKGATSLEKVTGRKCSLDEITQEIVRNLALLFEYKNVREVKELSEIPQSKSKLQILTQIS